MFPGRQHSLEKVGKARRTHKNGTSGAFYTNRQADPRNTRGTLGGPRGYFKNQGAATPIVFLAQYGQRNRATCGGMPKMPGPAPRRPAHTELADTSATMHSPKSAGPHGSVWAP